MIFDSPRSSRNLEEYQMQHSESRTIVESGLGSSRHFSRLHPIKEFGEATFLDDTQESEGERRPVRWMITSQEYNDESEDDTR